VLFFCAEICRIQTVNNFRALLVHLALLLQIPHRFIMFDNSNLISIVVTLLTVVYISVLEHTKETLLLYAQLTLKCIFTIIKKADDVSFNVHLLILLIHHIRCSVTEALPQRLLPKL